MAAAFPPGPSGGLFGLGLVERLRADLIGHCADLQKAHGDAVHYRVGPMRVFQFTHPEQAVEVLVERHRSFQKPANMKKVLGQWNGNGLVLSEGAFWVRQRRLTNPALKPQRLAGYMGSIAARAGRMLDGWAGRSEVDVSGDLARLTLGVVAEALFGADVERHTDRFIEAVAVLNEIAIREMTSPFVLPLWAPTPQKRRLRGAVETIRGVVKGIVAERRAAEGDRGDLLSMLLLAVDEEGDGGRMTDEQACDESVSLMLGGNETTATALTWALYLLATNPDAQEDLRREVIEVLGRSAPTVEAIPRLRGVEMAFKEAMRLYPPVYIVTREAIEDVTVGGFTIPRGSVVHLVPYVMQRDARWFEAPEAFRPSRFTREDAIPRGAFIPFGLGPRACIGRTFAMQEGVITLAMLLQRVRVRIPAGAPPLVLEAQVSLHPKGGLRLAIEPI